MPSSLKHHKLNKTLQGLQTSNRRTITSDVC